MRASARFDYRESPEYARAAVAAIERVRLGGLAPNRNPGSTSGDLPDCGECSGFDCQDSRMLEAAKMAKGYLTAARLPSGRVVGIDAERRLSGLPVAAGRVVARRFAFLDWRMPPHWGVTFVPSVQGRRVVAAEDVEDGFVDADDPKVVVLA